MKLQYLTGKELLRENTVLRIACHVMTNCLTFCFGFSGAILPS